MEAQIRIHIIDSNSNNIVDTHIQVIDSNNTLLNVKIIKENGSLYIKGLSKNEKYQISVSANGYEQQEQNVILYYETTVLVFILGKSGSSYYRISGVKIPYNRKENELVIIPSFNVKEKFNFRPQINQVKNQFNLEEISEIKNKHVSATEESLLFFVRPTDDKVYKEVLNSIHNLEIGIPCLELNNNSDKYTLVSDEIKILFSVKPSNKVLLELNEKFGLKSSIQKDKGIYRFWVTILNYDIFDNITKLNSVREKYGIESVSPVIYYPMYLDSQIIPTDFLFPEQWDFRISQIPEAWSFLEENSNNSNNLFGDKNIVVAVSDPDGIEISHPDLSGQLWDGSDKVFVSIDFVNLTQPVTAVDDHGTQCAGAALANANNSSLNPGFSQGIAGVAGGSKLAALRVDVPMDQQQIAESYMWLCGISVDSNQVGFPTILNRSVDVTSGSYLVGPLSSISDEMRFALDFATDFGRIGRGLAMFFSAGNEAVTPTYVATRRPWAAYNRTMGIAASTLGEIGTKEIWADYSNFGPEINFCAISGGRYEHNPPDTWRAWTTIRSGHGEALGFPGLNPTTVQDTVISQPSINEIEVNDGSLFTGQQTLIVGPPGDISPLGIYPEVRLIINVTGNIITVAPPFNNNHVGHTVLGGEKGYTPNFSGTSYSTPVAAGIAALILSVKPSLSWIELRETMETTARKINLDDNIKKWQDRHPDKIGANSILDSGGNLILETPIVSTSLTIAANASDNLNKALNFTTNTLTVISNTGFDIGDAIFISDGVNSEIKIIEAKSGNNKLIIDALRYSYNVGTIVQKGKYKPIFNILFGYGRINAYDALKKAHEYSHSWRDLVIRDHIGDNGTTNTQVNHYPIHSPDIWIRNTPEPITPVPPFNQEGPHENPKPDNDRYIYVRVKNIGNGNPALPANQKLKNLDAWVHIYVALSDRNIPPIDAIVNPSPGINSPFIFPGDLHSANSEIAAKSWMEDRLSLSIGGQNKISGPNGIMSGNMKVYHVADVNPDEPNIHIEANTIPHHAPSNPEASSYVVRIKWDQLDLPPVNTDQKIYLLAYVSPVDGERQGRGAELNNNMSFREIAFADFEFLDDTGTGNLKTNISVNEFGTNESTSFNVKVNQSIGSFETEDVTLEIIRERGNGTTDHLIFLYNDSTLAWEILNMNNVTIPITWSNITPPTETATGNPATATQTSITFTGDFDVSKEFSKVKIKTTIRGERDNTLWVSVAEDTYEMSVIEEASAPTGLIPSPGQPPLYPQSYTFTDFADLNTQPANLAFGPSTGNEANKFRVTSSFTASTDVNAYAMVNGFVMIQPGAGADKVNLILRPFTQPIQGFNKVKYIIYRGLRLDEFIDINDTTKVVAENSASNSEWITQLYATHHNLNPSGDFLSKALGYDPSNQSGSDLIDDYFFSTNADFQLPFISRGMQLGKFFANGGSSDFGIDIILEDRKFIPNLDYARTAFHEIDVTGLPSGTDAEKFTKRIKQDEVLNFMDIAAFYGIHHTEEGKVRRRNGSNNTETIPLADLYSDVIDKFATRNAVYIDIRNELGDSLNFFTNYNDGSGNQIQFGTESGVLTPMAYHEHGWPILIKDNASAPFDTDNDFNEIFLQLRVDDNLSPMLFVKHGDLSTTAVKNKFVEGDNLISGTNPWTNEIGLTYPNTGVNGAKLNVSWFLKLNYSREIDSNTVYPDTVVQTNYYADNLFGNIDAVQPWDSSDTTQWTVLQPDQYVDGSQSGFGQISEKGIAVDQAQSTDRVILYSNLTDDFASSQDFTPNSGQTSGTNQQESFLTEPMLFKGYNLDFNIINSSPNVTTLRFKPNPDNPISEQNTQILGLTKNQLDSLKSLSGYDNRYPRTVVFDKLGDFIDANGKAYSKFKLGVNGLDNNGHYLKQFPATDLEVYSLDELFFTSTDFANLEPKPTVYKRIDAEEVNGAKLKHPAKTLMIDSFDADYKWIAVKGVDARQLVENEKVTVSGSSGNDGIYTVNQIIHAGIGNTVIEVKEPIPNSSSTSSAQLTYSELAWEDYFIRLDQNTSIANPPDKMETIVANFTSAVNAVPNNETAPNLLETAVNTYAPMILNRARAFVQDSSGTSHSNLDDRILYWTRIKMLVILKSHPYLLASIFDRDNLVEKFEELSRGYSTVDFGGTSLKKILITGFDPFSLDRNIEQGNPSGLVALALHNTLVKDNSNNDIALIQTMIFPVRYGDFDSHSGNSGFGEGVVEKYIKEFIESNSLRVDMIITISQAGFENYNIDRFATRTRGGLPLKDNNYNYRPHGSSSINLEVGENDFEWIQTTLPKAMVPYYPETTADPNPNLKGHWIIYNQNYQLLDVFDSNTDLPANTIPPANNFLGRAKKNATTPLTKGTKVYMALGKNYLSNEIFYRVSLMRERWLKTQPTGTKFSSGHFHIAKIQSESYSSDVKSKASDLIYTVKDRIQRGVIGLTDLFTND